MMYSAAPTTADVAMAISIDDDLCYRLLTSTADVGNGNPMELISCCLQFACNQAMSGERRIFLNSR